MLNYHRGLNRLYQVRWNNYDRAPKMDWSLKQQTEWYRAAGHWNSIITRKDMEIWTQLEPGTALSKLFRPMVFLLLYPEPRANIK